MKFSITQVATTLLAVATVSGASVQSNYIYKRQSDTQSQYPESTNVGALNGTWYLTGITSNAWDVYQTVSQRLGINANCIQLDIASSSNSSLDATGSVYLTRASSGVGLSATAAGALYLSPPTSDLNISAHDLAWTAYVSQVFVNQAQWQNFVSNGQGGGNATESGSQPITGSEPMQATIQTRLIDSNAQAGSNDSSNFDTIFIWGSHAQTINSNTSKRDDNIYGAILSNNPSISQDTFNKTLALLPPAVNNATVVLLQDSCNSQQ